MELQNYHFMRIISKSLNANHIYKAIEMLIYNAKRFLANSSLNLSRVSFIILLLIPVLGTAQENEDSFFFEKEQAILKELRTIQEVQDDYLREKATERMLTNFEQALQKPSSFDYEFEGLNISKLRSEDDRVRIISWNVPQENGTQKYFGFVQYKTESKYKATRLTDASEGMEMPEKMRLTPDQWYGALYYDIIQTKTKKRTYYTLLGWDGYNYKMSQKIIDVMGFKNSGEPVFGANIFKARSKTAKRVILRYSSQAKVTLKYEKRKKWIVFDHLAPFKPQYAGVYEYYGPDMYHDAFVFKKGKWWLDTIVDVRNDKHKRPNRDLRYSTY